MTVFHKVLIANRGEIAGRVIRTARDMGFQTVAVYSDVDSDCPHVSAAHESVCIGYAAQNPYLNIEIVIAAALKTGATMVHPGYGFLSENAEFAEACLRENLLFVGPDARIIKLMGSKTAAKQFALEAGLPCVPGYHGDNQDESTLHREAEAIGYPVLIKSAFGGGGRGMRLVKESGEFKAHLRSARSESEKAFGNGHLFLEKALADARHIEFQILADQHGHVVHLGERDCSVQRRHQKVLEETPSPYISSQLRSKMGEAAVSLALTCGYEGVGTVEFLVDTDGEFYFLEMNTRLQVEHPVTEMVSGLDLVAWQFKVTTGSTLPFEQQDLELTGHAIEMRLCAEDPANYSVPQTGRILYWRPPTGEGIRVDCAITSGSRITAHYDSLLGKIICWGEDRHRALQRLHYALHDTSLLGLQTNKSQVLALLTSEPFASGEYTTAIMEKVIANLPMEVEPAIHQRALRVAALLIHRNRHIGRLRPLWPKPIAYKLDDGAQFQTVEVSQIGDNSFNTLVHGLSRTVRFVDYANNVCRIEMDGVMFCVAAANDGPRWYIEHMNCHFSFLLAFGHASNLKSANDGNQLVASMDGTVVDVLASVGDAVKSGQTIMVIESMKMESPLVAPADLFVERIEVSIGDSVSARQLLAVLSPDLR